jgi:hypothetical protein
VQQQGGGTISDDVLVFGTFTFKSTPVHVKLLQRTPHSGVPVLKMNTPINLMFFRPCIIV